MVGAAASASLWLLPFFGGYRKRTSTFETIACGKEHNEPRQRCTWAICRKCKTAATNRIGSSYFVYGWRGNITWLKCEENEFLCVWLFHGNRVRDSIPSSYFCEPKRKTIRCGNRQIHYITIALCVACVRVSVPRARAGTTIKINCCALTTRGAFHFIYSWTHTHLLFFCVQSKTIKNKKCENRWNDCGDNENGNDGGDEGDVGVTSDDVGDVEKKLGHVECWYRQSSDFSIIIMPIECNPYRQDDVGVGCIGKK